jgi:hypothetical protein
MKAKKALKRLDKVEKMLSDVLDGFSAIKQNVREFLDTAKASVGRATEAMKPKPGPKAEKKTKEKTDKAPVPKKPAKKKPAAKKPAPAKPAPAKRKKPVKAKKPKPAPPAPPRKKKPVVVKKRRRSPTKPPVHTRTAVPDVIEGTTSEPMHSETPAPHSESPETETTPVVEHEHLFPQE